MLVAVEGHGANRIGKIGYLRRGTWEQYGRAVK
jgi:hypothetical protein